MMQNSGLQIVKKIFFAFLLISFTTLGSVYGSFISRDLGEPPGLINMTTRIPDDPWVWRNDAGWRFKALNKREPWMEWLSVNSDWKKCAVDLADDVSSCHIPIISKQQDLVADMD